MEQHAKWTKNSFRNSWTHLSAVKTNFVWRNANEFRCCCRWTFQLI